MFIGDIREWSVVELGDVDLFFNTGDSAVPGETLVATIFPGNCPRLPWKCIIAGAVVSFSPDGKSIFYD